MTNARAVAVQTGAASVDLRANLQATRELILSLRERPDLVVLPELFSRPFWCTGFSDQRFLSWAEDLEGPTLTAMREVAKESGATVVVPFFERGELAGEYYNSAAVVDRDGEVVGGVLPSGESVLTYRKNAISAFRWDDQVNDEKFYFRPGAGFPVFRTDIGTIGVLICYDRWYPEAWRVLALQGAEVICVVNASHGSVSDMFVPSMRACAAQNLVFVVAVNRGGHESFEGHTVDYYGLSCIVGPTGELLGCANDGEPHRTVSAQVDLDEVQRQRTRQTMYRDRRPDLYGIISDPAWRPMG